MIRSTLFTGRIAGLSANENITTTLYYPHPSVERVIKINNSSLAISLADLSIYVLKTIPFVATSVPTEINTISHLV
jgi:hypothetical protein